MNRIKTAAMLSVTLCSRLLLAAAATPMALAADNSVHELPSFSRSAPLIDANAAQARTFMFKLDTTVNKKNIVADGLPLLFRLNSGDLSNSSFSDISGKNSGPAFRAYGGSMNNVEFKRLDWTGAHHVPGVGMGLILIAHTKVNHLTISDFRYSASSPNTDPGDVPAGIALQGKTAADGGSDITIRNGYIENVIAAYPERFSKKFLNADGIAVEKTYSNVLIENVHVKNVSDSGIDFKAADSRLNNIISEDNTRSFKLWNPNNHGTLYSINAKVGHVFIMGGETFNLDTKPLVIENLVVRSNTKAPIFRFENGATRVIVKHYDIKLPSGTPLTSMDGKAGDSVIDWGPQGEPKF